MHLPRNILRKKKRLVQELKRHGVLQAGIFGSYARGEQKKGSDIDILVKTRMGTSLIDFIGIKHSAEKILGITVDLVEYSAIKPRIKEQIFHDEVRIL
ncbi:nucleotidyltransferase family protein [Candidatus Woesearchaeota archaeon]|nr:nucleotidyltransferase family protein [Candidatus Woesearchaeota archaeon]